MEPLNCAKCEKQTRGVKKESKPDVTCMRCNSRYHQGCFGKKNSVVCYVCHSEIQGTYKIYLLDQLKQATLMDFGFRRSSISNSRSKNKPDLSFSNIKEKYEEEYTQASSFLEKNFKSGFP